MPNNYAKRISDLEELIQSQSSAIDTLTKTHNKIQDICKKCIADVQPDNITDVIMEVFWGVVCEYANFTSTPGEANESHDS